MKLTPKLSDKGLSRNTQASIVLNQAKIMAKQEEQDAVLATLLLNQAKEVASNV